MTDFDSSLFFLSAFANDNPLISTIIDSHLSPINDATIPDEINKLIEMRKKLSKAIKTLSTSDHPEAVRALQKAKKMKADISKALDKWEELSKKSEEYEKVKERIKTDLRVKKFTMLRHTPEYMKYKYPRLVKISNFIENVMIPVTLITMLAFVIYYIYLTQAEKVCTKEKGKERTICINKMKIEGYQNAINAIKSKKQLCRNTKKKQKCEEMLDKKIKKYEEKIAKLKAKMK